MSTMKTTVIFIIMIISGFVVTGECSMKKITSKSFYVACRIINACSKKIKNYFAWQGKFNSSVKNPLLNLLPADKSFSDIKVAVKEGNVRNLANLQTAELIINV